MLKYYIPTTEVRINSIKSFNIDVYSHKICESHPYTDVIKINWDNAEEEIQKHDIWLPFGITKRRKGLKLFFWDDLFTSVKQWKEDLDIEIKTSWIEYKPTIKEIMDFKDSDKAIQYLVERGLTVSLLIE